MRYHLVRIAIIALIVITFVFINLSPFLIAETKQNSLSLEPPKFLLQTIKPKEQSEKTRSYNFSTAEIARSIPNGCAALVNASTPTLNFTHAAEWLYESEISDLLWIEMAENCAILRELNPNLEFSKKSENPDFPLAFVMVTDQHIEQWLRLLASIFDPNNVCCIVIDNTTATALSKLVLSSLVECYDNVVTPGERFDIYWGHYSILQAIMACLKTIQSLDWRYVQILSGNDVPLKSNDEMIQILKQLRNTQDSMLTSNLQKQRWEHPNYFVPGNDSSKIPEKWRTLYREKLQYGYWISNLTEFKTPPHGLIATKGSYANTLTHDFIDYIFESQVAQDLYIWVNETFVPDELYFPTLIHSDPNAPGGYIDARRCLGYWDRRNTQKPWISRYDVWNKSQCGGKLVRFGCVFGVRDLPRLHSAKQLFAHKVYIDYQPATYFCQLTAIQQRNALNGLRPALQLMDDYVPVPDLNLSYYASLPAVVYSQKTKQQKEAFPCG